VAEAHITTAVVVLVEQAVVVLVEHHQVEWAKWVLLEQSIQVAVAEAAVAAVLVALLVRLEALESLSFVMPIHSLT
jgi:hypothetical protein